MIPLITFFLGLFIGWALTRLRLARVEHQRAKNEMNDEIDLRATPDNYLSKVQLMKKRYIEAKWKERVEFINKQRFIGSKPITEHDNE